MISIISMEHRYIKDKDLVDLFAWMLDLKNVINKHKEYYGFYVDKDILLSSYGLVRKVISLWHDLPLRNLNAVGCICLVLAVKYINDKVEPSYRDISDLCCEEFSIDYETKFLIRTEKDILKLIDYDFNTEAEYEDLINLLDDLVVNKTEPIL